MTSRPSLPLLVALAVLVPASVSAQSGGRLPKVLELPASTRAAALGGAYMMDSDHADALFYHPALLAGASGFGLEIQSWGEGARTASAAAATSWLGGGVAVGLQTLQYRLPATGPVPPGQDPLFGQGSSSASEQVAVVGFGRELMGFRIGAAAKAVEQRIGTSRDASALFDVGIAHDVGPLTAGVSYRNLGASADLGESVDRPEVLTLGVGAYGRPVGPLDLGVAGTLGRRGDGEVLAGLGLELGYWPINGRTFVGRIGLQTVPEGEATPLTMGFAFWGDSLVLEWAYQGFGGAVDQGSHRIGVGWR